MEKRYLYYKGFFESQFFTDKREQLNSFRTWSKVNPDNRFILSQLKEISEEDYLEVLKKARGPHIHLEDTGYIELRSGETEARRMPYEEILVFNYNKLNKTSEEIQEHEIAAEGLPELFQFIARKDGEDHGRLTGVGYCKVYELLKPEPVEPAPEKDRVISAPVPELGIKKNITQPGHNSGVNTNLSSNSGCLGGLLGLSPTGNVTSGNFSGSGMGLPANQGGCLGSLFGQGGGCARSGCGLLSLLMLAGMLMGLFKTCTQSTPTPAPIVIHDTVYVEKIRERIDTVRLLQTDTIRMVDSTRLINYETLTLPNVNFFTKSAKLTPSSIPDIQQVAEYLISHEGLEAVVIGHTDNLGDSKENLRLSADRAEAVRNMIVMMGVEEKRITAIGKGDSEPKADNSTEEGRLMNRRVELQLLSNQVIENKRTVIPPQP